MKRSFDISIFLLIHIIIKTRIGELVKISEYFGVFDGVGEVGFIKVEAGFPFLALTVAEVFHKFSGGVA